MFIYCMTLHLHSDRFSSRKMLLKGGAVFPEKKRNVNSSCGMKGRQSSTGSSSSNSSPSKQARYGT